jgi:hypothetical protein
MPSLYYLLTFTLPKELHALAFGHQKKIYGLLMRCAAASLQKLAADPRYVGGRLGLLGVLHTWTRAMLYHPHVHFLVTGGGLSHDGTHWIKPNNPAFLVPVQALSVIFRAKVCAALKKAGLSVPCPLEEKVGRAFNLPARAKVYLGRYIGAITVAVLSASMMSRSPAIAITVPRDALPDGACGRVHPRSLLLLGCMVR